MRSLAKFYEKYQKSLDPLRLGQAFCNWYVKESYPELYYSEDDTKTTEMIMEYLERYSYTEELPEVI